MQINIIVILHDHPTDLFDDFVESNNAMLVPAGDGNLSDELMKDDANITILKGLKSIAN